MMELLSENKCYEGTVQTYSHDASTTNCKMTFTIFIPPQASEGPVPALTYLAGLTCTPETFITKAGAFQMASALGLILIAPDTSPRGDDVPDEADAWDFGKGAGFYVSATEDPWKNNYQMERYITQELYDLVIDNFPVDPDKQGIFGHSMGGHGALTLYLKNQDKYQSVSAFAPICAPSECPWGHKALGNYLGPDRANWANNDATLLMKELNGAKGRPEILIDQGLSDTFLEEQLHPHLVEAACEEVGQKLTLRRHEGYDHGYFFIQTFMGDHLRHHARVLHSLQ